MVVLANIANYWDFIKKSISWEPKAWIYLDCSI